MPYTNSTLTCQVDGLVKVYTCDKNVYFAFETQEQLNKAKEKVIQLWDSKDCPLFRQKNPTKQRNSLDLSGFSPKEAGFSFSISAKSENESENESAEELIKHVASII